jgi:hypothetical protein
MDINEQNRNLRAQLSNFLEDLLEKYGDTPKTRLTIVNYVVGYMGASYGLHID